MFRDLHHDAKLLMISRGIRAFAFSYLGVVFAIYLDRLGYSTVVVGMIFSVAYISSALLTAVWGYLSDRFGRRRILMLLALLTIVSSSIYVFLAAFSLFFWRSLSPTSALVDSAAEAREEGLSIPLKRRYWPRNAARRTATASLPLIRLSGPSWALSGR